ncbi:hypothetical protein SDC9_162054 [bioreactor metagenome]|uniref:Uncharacterized protein n=1 Tax=bioreactor metagenome TaxID=1076179 RepID=A0A645FJZ3_9ZZZZ
MIIGMFTILFKTLSGNNRFVKFNRSCDCSDSAMSDDGIRLIEQFSKLFIRKKIENFHMIRLILCQAGLYNNLFPNISILDNGFNGIQQPYETLILSSKRY